MTEPFNVLLTSLSKKIPMAKAIQQAMLKLHLNGTLFGGDSDPACIGHYFVKKFWRMPPVNELTPNALTAYCQTYGIKAIIPSRDGELSFFAAHREALQAQGIACMISQPTTIDTCLNKKLFSQFLEQHHYPAIPTAQNIEELSSHKYVVKECFGTGSRQIGLNLDLHAAKQWATDLKHPVFQPFIKGDEYSVDLYVDRQGNVLGPIVRKRELIVDGESQITVSHKKTELEKMCRQLAIDLKIYGHAIFQIICDEKDSPHIIECNPRFGGASTLSLAMGLHSFEWFFQESLNIPLSPFKRGIHEICQVRFADDLLIPIEER